MNPHLRTKLLLSSFLLFLYSAGQQSPYKIITPQYELEHLKLNNKEDIGFFNDVAEDKEGYLWFSGTKGLHVFDGNRTVNYWNGNKQYMLAPDSVNIPFYSISKTADGSFWIQEEDERYILFDPGKRKSTAIFTKKNNIADKFAYSAISDDGSFFIATLNNQKSKVNIWEKTNVDSLVEIYSSSINLETSSYQYRMAGKNHWLIQQNQLTRISLDGKEVEQYNLQGAFLSAYIFFSDKHDLYYINNSQDAICRWNSETNKIEKFITLPPLVRGKLSGLYIKNNTVYIGSNLQLFIIDIANNTIQDLSPGFVALAKKEAPNSFATGFLNFFSRADGSFLVCTQADIYRLKKKVPAAEQFRQNVTAPGNISKIFSFRGLAEDDKKNIYASYYTGISKKNIHENVFKSIAAERYIDGDLLSTFSLNYWKGNLLWNNLRIDLATGHKTYMAGDKFGGHCTQWLHNDTLWFIQWNTNDLHCYDLLHNIHSSYQIDKAITKGIGMLNEINDITGDATGQNLWISTKYEGILLITKKGKLLKQYLSKDLSISTNTVTDLELVDDNLWFGCNDGLGILNIKSDKTIIYKNPVLMNNAVLQNRAIFSIQPDAADNFFLGSSYGLLWFNTDTREFYNLAEDHSLAKSEFNRASAFKASDDRYYFGSTDGLYSFMPDELEFFKTSNSIKPVKLYAVSIFNNRKNDYQYLSGNPDSLNKLVLQPFNNNIEFSFSVPEYYKPVYYSYRVIGQSDKWTDYKLDNKILLYGLQPGKYTLEVKASTGLGDENASYYSLPVEMKQVWYKKVWVIILFSLFAVALLVSSLRYRFNQKLQRQKDLAALRTKISSDLHDDVGTILSGLAMQSQVLAIGAIDETKGQLNEISSMSRDAMEHMRDTVWAMDSRKDKVENLVDRMRDFAEKNLPLKKFTHQFIIEKIDGKKFIDPEKRQQIYLIFKEAVTNVIKHSNGNHVIIHFSEDKNNLHLSVQDNGSEKPYSNSDGLGMSNMKMRAEKIGGTLSIKYENGFTLLLALE